MDSRTNDKKYTIKNKDKKKSLLCAGMYIM